MGGRVATTQEKLRLATTSEIYGQRPLPSISRIVIVLNIIATKNHQKYQNYDHSHHCCNHRYLVLSYALNVVFDVQKKWYKLPKLGGGKR